MSAMPPAEIVRNDFKRALRRLAKAVVIITCRNQGTRYAMAATAVSELSMDPPSMLVCVNKAASIHKPLETAEHFAVNILHSTHRPISEICSGAAKGEARFDKGDWAASDRGVPYLLDAQACIFCRMDRHIDYATHGIFFGLVETALTIGEPSPLIYMDGRYVVASSDPL